MAGPEDPAPIVADRVLAGRYQLLRPLARGGMAEVWEGRDTVLSRPVAIKLLQPHLAADGTFVERFRREAVTAARLTHPGVVATYDTGVDGGTAYIVMELVTGPTLRELVNDHGALDPLLVANLGGQTADALGHAHRAGLVHRDVKPANVLVTTDEWGRPRVKVTDFGIAKATEGLGMDLTRTGMVLGTPKYLSPEQIRGDEPDARADLYSLGVVLHEMLTGQAPFAGTTDMATAISHLQDPPPRLTDRCPGILPDFDRLIAALLAKDPGERPPSAAVVRRALADIEAKLRQGRGAPPTRGVATGPATSASPSGVFPSAPVTGGSAATAIAGAVGSPVGARTLLRGPSLPPPASPPYRARSNGRGRPSAHRVEDGEGGDGAAPLGPPRDRRKHRPGRLPALVVAGVAVAALIAAVVLVGSARSRKGTVVTTPLPINISSVSVFMVNDRPPDDPGGTRYTFDANPATAWETASYGSPDFGGLYPGIGLAIQLSGSHVLHRLEVSSPTKGWSAQVYVSPRPVPSPSPLGAWGVPVANQVAVAGDAVFGLARQHDQWILLWLTNLGPGRQVKIAEVKVR